MTRSIQQGFAVANKSWAGIGFFVVGWLALAFVTALAVSLTNPPRVLLEQPPAPPAMTTPAAPSATPSTQTSQGAGGVAEQERSRQMQTWLGRAWPVLLLVLVVFIAASLWLNGGQIGYLAQRVTTGHAPLATCWTAGTQALGRLLGAWSLSALAVGVGLLLFGLLAASFAALAKVLPTWLRVLTGTTVLAGLAAVVAWLVVRLAFWFITIVADRRGPLAGMRVSFHATQGRWWTVCGLLVLLGLINGGAWLVFRLLVALAGFIGGLGGTLITLAVTLAYIAASFYLGCMALAALIRYYEDTKAPSSSAAVPANG